MREVSPRRLGRKKRRRKKKIGKNGDHGIFFPVRLDAGGEGEAAKAFVTRPLQNATTQPVGETAIEQGVTLTCPRLRRRGKGGGDWAGSKLKVGVQRRN